MYFGYFLTQKNLWTAALMKGDLEKIYHTEMCERLTVRRPVEFKDSSLSHIRH